jgi:hypothetical protein
MFKFLSRIPGEREAILRKLLENWPHFRNLFFSITDLEYRYCTTFNILGVCRKIAKRGYWLNHICLSVRPFARPFACLSVCMEQHAFRSTDFSQIL